MTIFKIVTPFGVFFTEKEYLCIVYDYTTDDAVAQHCGFTDRTVLQRTFKRIEGITPQKYMEDLEANSSTHSSKA